MNAIKADLLPDNTLLIGSGGPGRQVTAVKLRGAWLVLREDDESMLVKTDTLTVLTVANWSVVRPLSAHTPAILAKIAATTKLVVVETTAVRAAKAVAN